MQIERPHSCTPEMLGREHLLPVSIRELAVILQCTGEPPHPHPHPPQIMLKRYRDYRGFAPAGDSQRGNSGGVWVGSNSKHSPQVHLRSELVFRLSTHITMETWQGSSNEGSWGFRNAAGDISSHGFWGRCVPLEGIAGSPSLRSGFAVSRLWGSCD